MFGLTPSSRAMRRTPQPMAWSRCIAAMSSGVFMVSVLGSLQGLRTDSGAYVMRVLAGSEGGQFSVSPRDQFSVSRHTSRLVVFLRPFTGPRKPDHWNVGGLPLEASSGLRTHAPTGDSLRAGPGLLRRYEPNLDGWNLVRARRHWVGTFPGYRSTAEGRPWSGDRGLGCTSLCSVRIHRPRAGV